MQKLETEDFRDLQENIALMLKGINFVKPLTRLHENLSAISEIVNQVDKVMKVNNGLSADRDALRADIETLTAQRNQLRFETKEHAELTAKMKQVVAVEIEKQRTERLCAARVMEEDARTAMAKAKAEAREIDVERMRTQNIASLEHIEWRKQADSEIAEATQRLETLQRAATSIQDKIAQLTS